MDDDQIDQQDLLQNDEHQERPLSDRERMMEELAAKRMADIQAEASEPDDEDDTDGQDETDDLQREVQNEQAEAKVLDGDADKTVVKLKINGEERDVPLSKLIADAQKHEAADQRLAEASRILREARSQASQPSAPQTQDPVANKDPDAVKTFITALFSGDEAEAEAALASLITHPSQPTVQVDPMAIAEQVKASMERDAALQRFTETYPQVIQDVDIATLADAKVARRIEAGETFSQALAAVGEEFASKFGWTKDGQEAPATTDTRQAKLEQKRTRENVIRGQNLSAATTQPPPQTASQVIAEMQMQRARGLWQPRAR